MPANSTAMARCDLVPRRISYFISRNRHLDFRLEGLVLADAWNIVVRRFSVESDSVYSSFGATHETLDVRDESLSGASINNFLQSLSRFVFL